MHSVGSMPERNCLTENGTQVARRIESPHPNSPPLPMPLRPRLPLVGSACALVLCLALTGACRTEGPDTAASDSEESDTTLAEASTDTSTTPADSTDAIKNPPPAPAPGTARIRAEIVSCEADAQPVRCQIRVEEVLAYGSTTPSLRPGTYPARLAASLLNDRTVSDVEALGPRTLVVRHGGDQPDLGDPSDAERPTWTIQSIE